MVGWPVLLSGCGWGHWLYNKTAYDARLAELTDDDGDGYHEVDGDCDDQLASTYPGADERCDQLDNDCDGQVDEEPISGALWFADQDQDGFGVGVGIASCEPLEQHAEVSGDCDDANVDANPAAVDIPYDGIDNDCDGEDLVDVAADGFVAEQVGGTDCDDEDGAADVLMAARGADSPAGENSGALYVFLGLGDYHGALAAEDADIRFTGQNADDYSSTSDSGDLDSDGYDDVVVSSSLSDAGGLEAGQIYVVYGAADLADRSLESADAKILGSAGDQVGLYLDTGGDIDGDDRADLLVQAWGADLGGSDSGASYIFTGPIRGTQGLDASAAVISGSGIDPVRNGVWIDDGEKTNIAVSGEDGVYLFHGLR